MTNILIILGFFLLFILTYLGRGYWGWVLSGATWLGAWGLAGGMGTTPFTIVTVVAVLAAVEFGIPSLRRALISGPVMKMVAKILPKMGDTERIALDRKSVV